MAGAHLELQWRTKKDAISTVVVGSKATGTNGWTQRSEVLRSPGGAVRARLTLFLGKESDGQGSAWFDELSLVRD